MIIDPDIEIILAELRENPVPDLSEIPLVDARKLIRDIIGKFDVKDVPIGRIENHDIAGPDGNIPIRIYTGIDSPDGALPALVYFHGGGWIMCDIDTHDALCRSLANDSGCRVVSVGYRLAPEHVFPAAIEDGLTSIRWVADQAETIGVDPTKIGVAGDSAGGNIAAVISQIARDRGPKIAFQLLMYPITDVAMDSESYHSFARGFFLEDRSMCYFIDLYAGKADRSDPRLAPLKAASFEGLPPTLVVTAGRDVLHDEGRLYAEALRAAGVHTEYIDYPGLIHGFATMQAISASREAVAMIGERVRQALI